MAENYYNEDALLLGRQIKSLRALTGMNQLELGKACAQFTPEGKPLRQSTIASIEKGRYNTSVRTLNIILSAMGYEMRFVKKQTTTEQLPDDTLPTP